MLNSPCRRPPPLTSSSVPPHASPSAANGSAARWNRNLLDSLVPVSLARRAGLLRHGRRGFSSIRFPLRRAVDNGIEMVGLRRCTRSCPDRIQFNALSESGTQSPGLRSPTRRGDKAAMEYRGKPARTHGFSPSGDDRRHDHRGSVISARQGANRWAAAATNRGSGRRNQVRLAGLGGDRIPAA